MIYVIKLTLLTSIAITISLGTSVLLFVFGFVYELEQLVTIGIVFVTTFVNIFFGNYLVSSINKILELRKMKKEFKNGILEEMSNYNLFSILLQDYWEEVTISDFPYNQFKSLYQHLFDNYPKILALLTDETDKKEFRSLIYELYNVSLIVKKIEPGFQKTYGDKDIEIIESFNEKCLQFQNKLKYKI